MHGFQRGFAISVCLLMVAVAGCSDPDRDYDRGYDMVEVPSANQNSRINHLVIHFTSENFAESMRLLTEPSEGPVSAHYLVPDTRDETYDRDEVVVHSLVPEARRAWHAGRSAWAGENTLNNRAIGIEIVNVSRCETPAGMNEVTDPDQRACTFQPYSDAQVEVVIALARDILARHPDIDPVDVVGHGDITPARRVDPGPLFPWQRLHEAGIGAWPDPARTARYLAVFEAGLPSALRVQTALAEYGYEVETTGALDTQTRFALQAFQMHFRQDDYSGAVDAETLAILFALLAEFRPEATAISQRG